MVAALPERLRAAQTVFDATGGLHAAACFTPDGDLVALREDVGRHNAVDKLVGHAVARAASCRSPDDVLLVSGRVSFEIVQKAAMAGIPIVVRGVGAVEPGGRRGASASGRRWSGFVRGDRANVYTHPERLDLTR